MTEDGRDGSGYGGGADCPECGAKGVGGEEGCEILFQEVVGREFSQPELFQVHRITVDAYSLQHPDRYMESAKSAVAHLMGMCWTMEGEADPAVSLFVSRFLDGNPEFARPHPQPDPGSRGDLTVSYVHGSETSRQHIERVWEWAREAWGAWAAHQDQARRWLLEARSGKKPGGKPR